MGPSSSLTLEEVLEHLKDTDETLSSSLLTELSDLDRNELATFLKTWMMLPVNRRRDTVHRLAELSEENFELNYDSIFRCLLKDDDSEVRFAAVGGLWESEDASLILPLIRLLKEDPSPEVQAAAATALSKFAMLAEDKKLRHGFAKSICQTLLEIVNNTARPVEVRRRALEAVAPISVPEVVRAISAAYQSGDAKFRISAIYAMGRSCNLSFIPTLRKELMSPDAEVRYEAATALGEMGEEEAVSLLAEHLEDPDLDVQLAVIWALGRIGGAQARRYLKLYLESEVGAVAEAAEEALEELESGESPLGFGL